MKARDVIAAVFGRRQKLRTADVEAASLALPAAPRGGGGSGAPGAKALLSGLLAGALLAAVLLVGPGAALAAFSHVYSGESFGPDGTEATSFSGAGAIAVDPAAHAVYVADVPAGAIYKFDESHQPQNFSALGTNEITGIGFRGGAGESQIAVDPTSGRIYATAGNSVLAFEASGAPAEFSALAADEISGFSELLGVAVDSAGDIYAGDYNTGVYVYAPSGAEIASFESEHAANLAVDSHGDVYVDHWQGSVEKYVPSESPPTASTTWSSSGEVDGNRANSVAVDAGDDLYVAEGQGIRQFDESGTELSDFGASGAGALSESRGVATLTSGEVLASDASGNQRVEVFGPLVTLPEATTEAASGTSATGATLHGHIDPAGGPEASCEFQYVSGAEFEASGYEDAESAACTPAGPFTSAEDVTAAVSGLGPETLYHFRLLAESEAGQVAGNDQTFTTAPAVGGVTTGPASGVSKTTATLTGSLEPGGEAAHYYFEWGTDSSYGNSAPAPPGTEVPAGPGSAPASVELSGLQPETAYHYRLVATNGLGTSRGEDQSFTTAPAVGGVTTGPASDVTKTAATLTGSLEPGGEAAHYYFEWGTDSSYGNTAPAPPGTEVPAGPGSVPASAELTGLQPESVYHYRLVATNGLGTSRGEDRAFLTGATVAVATEEASAVGVDSATLNGSVDPGGNQITDCHFAWGEDPRMLETAPCSPSPGAGSGPVAVHAQIAGLQAGHAYYFRLIAGGSAGSGHGEMMVLTTEIGPTPTSCPNEDRRVEEHATYLPDCRAYEMVSPAVKNGADVSADPGRTRAAQEEPPGDPQALMFSSLGGFADAHGSGIAFEYLAQRTGLAGTQGWSTHAVTPRQQPLSDNDITGVREPLYVGDAAPDLSRALFHARSPLGPAPNSEHIPNLYLRSDLRQSGAGAYQLLTEASSPISPAPGSTGNNPRYNPTVAGASTDLSHVLIEDSYRLTADAPASPTTHKLYESVDGAVRFVGYIPPAGQTECTGIAPACEPAPETVAGQGPLSSVVAIWTPHVISADGSRIFFTVPSNPVGVGAGAIYMRDDKGTQTTADDTTVELNAPESGNPEAPAPALFWDAAADGSAAVISSGQRLTNHPIVGEALYLWRAKPDAQGHHLLLISPDEEPADRMNVEGVFGLSASGDTVYFVARGQLVAGQPVLGEELGIYAWNRSEGVSYLGEMTDGRELSTPDGDVADSLNNIERHNELGARVTPDGAHLLLSLASPPSPGGPAQGECEETLLSSTVESCRELYLFARHGGSPVCVSCSPTGVVPSSPAFISRTLGTGGSLSTTYLNHPMSADGSRVFFTTGESLVPADTNGTNDVYEWEAVGHGGCRHEEADQGCVYLLSSGTSPTDSRFLDANPSGTDVFFATRQPLLGWDGDRSVDVYDARVGGGFAEPPTGAAICQGQESCRPASAGAVTAPSPATPAFTGPPNQRRVCPQHARHAGSRRCTRLHHRHHHHHARHRRHHRKHRTRNDGRASR